MTVRVPVPHEIIDWAIERSGRELGELRERFPALDSWSSGAASPTLRQLEGFARATYTPVGFFFLPAPPEDRLPVADFRSGHRSGNGRPSPNLLDTIALCEQRQDWYRQFARTNGFDRLEFVGSLSTESDPATAARTIGDALAFRITDRSQFRSWSEALVGLVALAEDAGVLVMVSGVVGSNTHRRLDPDEFRGFALADDLAPVVFINGTDTKAAQIFTLAHELAHVWLGATGVSNARLDERPTNQVERWCDAVAAELLVPLDDFRAQYDEAEPVEAQLQRLARRYRVSSLVILRRTHDAGLLGSDAYREAYGRELERIVDIVAGAGGYFYATQPVRVSKAFTRAVLIDTLEGGTLRRDAFRMLGFSKSATFDELAHRLGVIV